MGPVYYPRLIKRVRAALIDSVVIPSVAVAALALGYALGVTEFATRVLLVALTVFVLEPGLIAAAGGTIGHYLVGVRVRKKDGAENLNIFSAAVRALLKFLLGWLSLIFVLTTRQHQAIHDLVCKSIVVHHGPGNLPHRELLTERTVEDDRFSYPGKPRRAFVAVLYFLLITAVLSIVPSLLVSDGCLTSNQCTALELLATLVIDVAWLLMSTAVAVLGWNGRLPGARRRERANA